VGVRSSGLFRVLAQVWADPFAFVGEDDMGNAIFAKFGIGAALSSMM
jgi:hypothetical protein